MSKGIRQYIDELEGILLSMAGCMDLLYKAFLRNDTESLEAVTCTMRNISERMPEVTDNIARHSKHQPDVAHLISVPSTVGRIHADLLTVARVVEKKVREDILFSDLAIEELSYMLERTRDIVLHLEDMLMSGSELGKVHVLAVCATLEAKAEKFAALHQDRLVEGLCMPKSSGLFIEALWAMKNIAWLSHDIARVLGVGQPVRCEI